MLLLGTKTMTTWAGKGEEIGRVPFCKRASGTDNSTCAATRYLAEG